MSTKRCPPYVTRCVVYAVQDPECGHFSLVESAYRDVASDMWLEGEESGRVPKMPRGGNAGWQVWFEHNERTVKRLARWLAWVDSKQQKGPNSEGN